MSLSIFDIAKNISWTNEGRFYLTQKESKYELLTEYLSGFNIQEINSEIASIYKTIEIISSNDNKKIANYFTQELHGFNEDSTAFVGGATDFSVSLIFSFIEKSTYLKHVYGEPNETYPIDLCQLIHYMEGLKKIINSVILNKF